MSNAEIIRGGYEAFARQDLAAVFAVFDENIEWTTPEGLPMGGTFRGHEGVKEFFESLPTYFEELHVEPERYVEDGDTVVAIGRHRGRAAGGTEFDVPFAMVWTLRDGKAVTFREYNDSIPLARAVEGAAATSTA